jgi:hypothetical protein
MFIMLWAYMSFSQYLLSYSGNIAEEAAWFEARNTGGWAWISGALIPFHFALPFLVLLAGTNVKKDLGRLATVAAYMLLMRLVDVFWWVTPTFRKQIGLSFFDVGLPLLLGGGWLWCWVWMMQQRRAEPVVPLRDPRLDEAAWREVVEHG